MNLLDLFFYYNDFTNMGKAMYFNIILNINIKKSIFDFFVSF